jgi:hypothetical protein
MVNVRPNLVTLLGKQNKSDSVSHFEPKTLKAFNPLLVSLQKSSFATKTLKRWNSPKSDFLTFLEVILWQHFCLFDMVLTSKDNV